MPIAQTDVVQTFPDTPVIINVLANDSGDELTITGLNDPAFGTVSLNRDQTLTYTPNADFEGTDTFTYTIRDQLEDTVQGLVSVTVAPPNNRPDAQNDQVMTIVDRALDIHTLANDSDPDGDHIAYTALSTPGHGTVSINEDQSLRYVPEEGYIGTDSFTYTIGDGRGFSDTATVNIEVMLQNNIPEATDDNISVMKNVIKNFDIFSNDSDNDNDEINLIGLSLPVHGLLSVNRDFTLTYKPKSDFIGQDSFTYTIRDSRGGQDSAKVTINVLDVNNDPVASDDTAQTFVNQPVTISVLNNDNDTDMDDLSIIRMTMPMHGTIGSDESKSIIYTPTVGYIGADSFTYTVSDGRNGEATASVSINVIPEPTPTTYNNGYTYRRKIVVPANAVQGNQSLANFPLLFREEQDWLRSSANGGRIENGTFLDVRFESIDGKKLDHEIERYDPALGQLAAWIRLQSFLPADGTEFYVYYGKPGIAFGEEDIAGVWRDYLAVYHLPSGVDRTGQGRDLQVSNVATGALIGDAGSFNGATSVMSRENTTWLDGFDQFSAQIWVKSESDNTDSGFISVGSIDGQDSSLGFGIRYDKVGFSGGGNRVLTLEQMHSDGRERVESASDVQTTASQSIVSAWRSGEIPKIYVDGMVSTPTFEGSTPRAGLTAFSSGSLYIGAGSKDSAQGGWHGMIDEVRFRSEALSDAWIMAEHANQHDPKTFYGLSGEDAFGDANEAPVALPEMVVAEHNTDIEIDVLANDVDPENSGSLSIVNVETPENGTATITSGKITYSPATGFVGHDRFSYLLEDGSKTSRGFVSIRVNAAAAGTGGVENDDLPYSGLFYGCATCGVTPSNWRFRAAGYSQRFRCERTGSINKVRWWNKFDTREGYHTGDGGVIKIELHADNGRGWPSGTPIATSANIEAPVDIGVFPLIKLTSAAPVTKGERYHIVYRQLASKRGTISVNENWTYVHDTPLSPWFQDDLASLKPVGRGWEVRHGHHPVFEVHYTDGIVKGQGYLMGFRKDRRFVVGNKMIRQRFAVKDFTRVVEAIHFRLHRTSTTGRNLTMRLKDGSGMTLETIVIPENDISLDPHNDSRTSLNKGLSTRWIKKTFAKQHTLSIDSTYYLELSASSGASYVIFPQQDGKRSGWGFLDDKLEEGKTRAEYSTDGGKNWRGASFFRVDNRNDLDYPFLFELA